VSKKPENVSRLAGSSFQLVNGTVRVVMDN
jgi:hypothetical protein